MSVQSTDLFGLAKELAAFLDENRWRAAINRAYYASYHHALDWEQAQPAPGSAIGPAGGAHRQLINRLRHPAPELSNVQKAKSKVLGAHLETQLKRRTRADYRLREHVTELDMNEQIAEATVVIGIK